MTREEQIINMSVEYTESRRPICIGGQSYSEVTFQMNRNHAFEDGAKWADNNPKNDVYRDANGDILSLEEIEKRYKQGVEHRKQKIIDKACKWLEDYLYEYTSHQEFIGTLCRYVYKKDAINEFRKYMDG